LDGGKYIQADQGRPGTLAAAGPRPEAGSRREIATLQKGEIVQKKDRTFIQRHRTKSDVYAEWELWPETCAALEYLGQRPNDTPYVVVNERGNPLVQGTPKGNENQTIKNHWDRLLERVDADHSGFHRLPFKCL
jgi:hypothetical protein